MSQDVNSMPLQQHENQDKQGNVDCRPYDFRNSFFDCHRSPDLPSPVRLAPSPLALHAVLLRIYTTTTREHDGSVRGFHSLAGDRKDSSSQGRPALRQAEEYLRIQLIPPWFLESLSMVGSGLRQWYLPRRFSRRLRAVRMTGTNSMPEQRQWTSRRTHGRFR